MGRIALDSAAMGAVDEALAPGEELRFEGGARGWPPFTLEAAAGYTFFLAPLLLLTAAGGLAAVAGQTIDVGVSGLWPVSLPLWLLAVGLIVAVEAWRVVSFRSTVHAVTTRRVLTLRGVVRVRVRAELALTGHEAVTLEGGDPCVGGLRLVGLGAESYEAVRLALGRLPEPAEPSPRRRRGRVFGVVALVLLGAAQVVGALGNRDRARFKALDQAIDAAVEKARTRVDPSPFSGGSRSFIGGPFTSQEATYEVAVLDPDRREPGEPTQPLTVAAARIEARLPWGPLVYGSLSVTVSQPAPAERNAELLRALKDELAAAGVDATWR